MKRKLLTVITLLIGLCFIFAACSGGEESEAMRMYREAQQAGYGGSYLDFLSEYSGWTGLDKPVTPDSEPEPVIPDSKPETEQPTISLAATSVVQIEATFNMRSYGQSYRAVAGGAGVIYSLDAETWDAYIITNYHVIYQPTATPAVSDKISVWLYGGNISGGELKATFVGGVMDNDIAVLRIAGSDSVGAHTNADVLKNSVARSAKFADSDELRIGEPVYAIGNPGSDEYGGADGISVTSGVVSVEAEYITMGALDGSSRKMTLLEIRTDASVNHGNSGGGLFNASGELVGIVNARTEVLATGIVGVGYALPVNMALAVARNVIDEHSGRGLRGKLGFTARISDSRAVLDESGLSAHIEETMQVQTVAENSAAAGKLQAGDIILSYTLGGKTKRVTREYMFSILAFELRLDSEVKFTVLRGGEQSEVTLAFASLDYFDIV